MSEFDYTPVQFTHDLGVFATAAALQAQYPTGRPGDYATVTETNTVWTSNGTAWADSTLQANLNWVGTQADYNAIVAKNPQTLYFIIE